MKSEERRMILDLFDRISRAPQDNIDVDAARLIREAVARDANAPYVLVQTVLLQEEALRRADERIRDLEDAVSSDDRAAPSFLSPGRRPQQGGGSVPSAGVRSDSYGRGDEARYAAPTPPPSAGGGFLSSALSTASGVAGGMLLADSIRGLFGGSHGSELWGRTAEAHAAGADTSRTDANTIDWAARDREQDTQQDADDDQDARQDADDDQEARQDADDDGGWDGGDSTDA